MAFGSHSAAHNVIRALSNLRPELGVLRPHRGLVPGQEAITLCVWSGLYLLAPRSAETCIESVSPSSTTR